MMHAHKGTTAAEVYGGAEHGDPFAPRWKPADLQNAIKVHTAFVDVIGDPTQLAKALSTAVPAVDERVNALIYAEVWLSRLGWWDWGAPLSLQTGRRPSGSRSTVALCL